MLEGKNIRLQAIVTQIGAVPEQLEDKIFDLLHATLSQDHSSTLTSHIVELVGEALHEAARVPTSPTECRAIIDKIHADRKVRDVEFAKELAATMASHQAAIKARKG